MPFFWSKPTQINYISNDINNQDEYNTTESLFPISFAIPKCKIRNNVLGKEKWFGTIIPGDSSTYIFKTEEEYYNDYGSSVFGYTKCKAGWDCMRHYEILANGCIPYFTDLDNCPSQIMTHFPKNLVASAMNEIGSFTNDSIHEHKDIILKYTNQLLQYTRDNLTTEKMASYILKASGNNSAKSVLYLSEQLVPDYLRCTMLHGFKELFKTNCHDIPRIPHIYTDFENSDCLYGRGFSYTCLLDSVEYRDNKNDTTVVEDIMNKKYDVVIYGMCHKGMPFWDIVNQSYSKDKIILLCGEDFHDTTTCRKYAKDKYPTFIRELL